MVRILSLVLLIAPLVVTAQHPRPWSSAELQKRVDRLSVLGSVLYIAAHPDDENTAFLATMVHGEHLRTAYLAMTRGEGGQNLIGSEQNALLGMIRSQELLAARRIDGAEQLFSRAIDFGYSKTTDETVRFWGKERMLSDLVRIVRRFRPDVIVTRFLPDRGGHGNHTASAALAIEAFPLAGDATAFPGHAAHARPWQPARIVWNTFRFGREDPPAPVVNGVSADLGRFDPVLGVSYAELAGQARTMHKSQGFGASQVRGELVNTFEHIAGTPAVRGLMDGLDLSWTRVPGSARVAAIVDTVQRSFRPSRPWEIIPALFRLHAEIATLSDAHWVGIKQGEVEELILGCAGLWLDVLADKEVYARGERMRVTLNAVNRSPAPFRVRSWELIGGTQGSGADLPENRLVRSELSDSVPSSHPFTRPFWLQDPSDGFAYAIGDPLKVGVPHEDPAFLARIELVSPHGSVRLMREVRFRTVDPIDGETFRPVHVLPRAVVSIEPSVLVVTGSQSRTVRVSVQAIAPVRSAVVRPRPPAGWTMSPVSAQVTDLVAGEQRVLSFTLSASPSAANGDLGAVVTADGEESSFALTSTTYKHIPPQRLLAPAKSRLVRTDVRVTGGNVGYIMGAGDEIPAGLEQLGLRVSMMTDDELRTGDLRAYDVIIAGVRAYNTNAVLRASQRRLREYMESGGTFIAQYVTTARGETDAIGPYALTIGRDRVTEEDAPVTFLAPDHPVMRSPNRITKADFDGWVQERGLYFASEWSPEYRPLLAFNDTGEQPLRGGLVVATVGRGAFVYTGLAFFRQLPAGVPGAYRLLANLVSIRPGP